jgi:hypothetical protein
VRSVGTADRIRGRIRPDHALIRGLRETGSETELTRALASVLGVEPAMASGFLRVVVEAAPHRMRIDLELRGLLARGGCSAPYERTSPSGIDHPVLARAKGGHRRKA